MKRIALLGSTGSIGRQTLDVVRRLPGRLKAVALGAGSGAAALADQVLEFGATPAALYDADRRDEFARLIPGSAVDRHFGPDSLEEIATRPDVDMVVVAVAGAVGTRATIAALIAGKDVALATKEVLVCAGHLVREAARIGGGSILPVDSEHSALFQCMQGHPAEHVARIWLTASGGPFRTLSSEDMARVTTADALSHPTWSMGRKVTIDSATMMNKGLETIEARWLFDIPYERIGVVVHPQSVIHSFVEMIDGVLLAQLALPDMRLPIEYALLYPDRTSLGSDFPRLDPTSMSGLTFEPADEVRFPCLALARKAGRAGGTAPSVLNAANEAAVELFLGGHIPLTGIAESIEAAMSAHEDAFVDSPNLEQVLMADRWARGFVAARGLGILA